jgi:hypothetical protein
VYDSEFNACDTDDEPTSVNINKAVKNTISGVLDYLDLWQTKIESAPLNQFFTSHEDLVNNTFLLKADKTNKTLKSEYYKRKTPSKC